jgi:nicotinate-nucleotide adenylyltransferase
VIQIMQRIGIFGGSFNPVTYGHLLIAQAAMEELALDRLFFVPAAQSPFKPGARLATPAARLRLLRLAMPGRTRWEIDDQELRRGGISYTVETLADYHLRFPQANLFYLLGADHAARLPEWQQAEKLARLASFALFPRPGAAPPTLPPPFEGRVLKGVACAISASLVRTRAKAGQSLDGLVPPAVAEAISQNQLFPG